MNPEIDKKLRKIKRKCFKGHPEKYPDYCRRAVLDLLDIMNDMREEIAANENKVENLAFVNDFVTIQEATI